MHMGIINLSAISFCFREEKTTGNRNNQQRVQRNYLNKNTYYLTYAGEIYESNGMECVRNKSVYFMPTDLCRCPAETG